MFCTRLNETRKLRKVTAQQMANHLEMGLRSYRNYESGDREPSLDMLVKIADKLNVSVDYLLCRDDFLKSLGVSVDELRKEFQENPISR